MLVEEKGDKVRIYAGRAISRRLLLVLGPRRAWHLFMSVKRFKVSSKTNLNIERRKFLSYVGLLFGSFVFRKNIPNPINFAEDRVSLPPSRLRLNGELGSVRWKLLQGQDEIQVAARAKSSQEVRNLAKILISKGYTPTGEQSHVVEMKGADFTIRGLWLPYRRIPEKGRDNIISWIVFGLRNSDNVNDKAFAAAITGTEAWASVGGKVEPIAADMTKDLQHHFFQIEKSRTIPYPRSITAQCPPGLVCNNICVRNDWECSGACLACAITAVACVACGISCFGPEAPACLKGCASVCGAASASCGVCAQRSPCCKESKCVCVRVGI